MNNYTIYYHTFPNGKMYFGQTCLKPEFRWGKDGNGYKGQKLMWRAIQKYGWENIDHRIISIGLDKEEADFQEMFYIYAYRTNEPEFGYNLTDGGGGSVGYKHTEEAKKNMSMHRSGELHCNYGKHLSDETKKKMSESMKGKFCGDKNPMYGKNIKDYMSEEDYSLWKQHQKDNILKGKNHPMYGKKHSEESLKKMSESHKGHPCKYKGECRPKFKWLTTEGNIVEMAIANAKRHHPDWIKIEVE